MYASTNTIRLIQMSVEVTAGEFATAVFCSPCTIQGCLPFSVTNHPAVFIKNGVMTAHTPSNRNTLELRSFPLTSMIGKKTTATSVITNRHQQDL